MIRLDLGPKPLVAVRERLNQHPETKDKTFRGYVSDVILKKVKKRTNKNEKWGT